MASLSSISSREIREPTFTFDQEKAMQYFFKGGSDCQVGKWNNIQATDQIWERCMESLIDDYARLAGFERRSTHKRYTHFTSTKYVVDRCLEVLYRQKQKGDFKRFFCEHVLTNPAQIKNRLARFIARMDLNEDAQYTCLVASSYTHSIVDCSLIVEKILHPSPTFQNDDYASKSAYLKHKVKRTVELDIVLDKNTIYDSPRYCHLPERICIIDRTFNAECESIIAVQGLRDAIQASMKKAFSEKVGQIRSTERRKELVGGLAVLTAIVAIGLFLSAYNSK